MSDNPMTDEALERLQRSADFYRHRDECSLYTADLDALLASYRALQSENRIAMRALKLEIMSYCREKGMDFLPDYVTTRLAEARAQEKL